MSVPLREAHVDLEAISANVRSLRSAIGTAHTMAVVKARGYGHGAVSSARAALDGGADWLGVADIPEALELRGAGITAPILTWLHGPEADFAAAAAAGVDLGLSSVEHVEKAAHLEAADASHGPTIVQLKVDTGLGRNGVTLDDCDRVFGRAAELERQGRIRVRGVFSHLANASEADDAAQLAAFDRALALADAAGLTPELRHIASTAGAIRRPASRYDLVRLGIGIYGLSPFEDESVERLAERGILLRPAMRLSAAIVSTKRVPAGSGVSYGLTYRTPATSTLALVPLGYADGVPRSASGSGPVSIGGRRYRVAGRIAMDQLVVDVGDDPVAVGDRAVLFGDPTEGMPTARDWADAAGTIEYDIVTRIGGRVDLTTS